MNEPRAELNLAELGPVARAFYVIQTSLTRRGDPAGGPGSPAGPSRTVLQYWSREGKLLAEIDPWERERAQRQERTIDLLRKDRQGALSALQLEHEVRVRSDAQVKKQIGELARLTATIERLKSARGRAR